MRTMGILIFLGGLTMAQPAGVLDTVGGTTYDNQNSGPSLQWVGFVSGVGIHVAWMYSAQPHGSNWPDRNMKYNFYDLSTGSWNWTEPDFMNSGMKPVSRRTGYGTLEVSPQDGVALIGCHYNAGGMPPQFAPTLARDLLPGAGIFDECVGAPTLTGYFLPIVAMTPDFTVHLLTIKFAAEDNLYYSRSTFWCTWETPVGWSQTGAFGHNLVASTQSNKLLATWMRGNGDSLGLYYRLSTDGGATWEPVAQLSAPAAYGGDTVTVCARGASSLFDMNDDWLLVTTVSPSVVDSVLPNPAELWLYSSGTATWHRIHRAESHTLAGGFGPHASICDRPSLGQNRATGRLFVAWEQFDSSNVEPSTSLLRADVFLASSADGVNWSAPVRLTAPDQSSKRFPNIARNCSGDSFAIAFIQDSIAGFNSDSVGAVSNNPVCVWRGRASGVGECDLAFRFLRPTILASPNPSGTAVYLRLLADSSTELRIYDMSGQLVRRLAVSHGPSGSGSATWDGRDGVGVRVPPGCYYACSGVANAKLVLTQ